MDALLVANKAVAERYGLSTRGIELWLADTDLGFPRPIKIRRRLFFLAEELNAFDRAKIAPQRRMAGE